MSQRVEVSPIDPVPQRQIPVTDGNKQEQKVVRNASNGRFAPKAEADSKPDTTVTETVKRKPVSKKAKATKARTKKCPVCVDKPGLKPGTDHELCPRCNGTGKVKA